MTNKSRNSGFSPDVSLGLPNTRHPAWELTANANRPHTAAVCVQTLRLLSFCCHFCFLFHMPVMCFHTCTRCEGTKEVTITCAYTSGGFLIGKKKSTSHVTRARLHDRVNVPSRSDFYWACKPAHVCARHGCMVLFWSRCRLGDDGHVSNTRRHYLI